MKLEEQENASSEAVEELVTAIYELNRSIKQFSAQLQGMKTGSQLRASGTLEKDELDLLLPKPVLH